MDLPGIYFYLKPYCDRRRIQFTRGRPYKKDDDGKRPRLSQLVNALSNLPGIMSPVIDTTSLNDFRLAWELGEHCRDRRRLGCLESGHGNPECTVRMHTAKARHDIFEEAAKCCRVSSPLFVAKASEPYDSCDKCIIIQSCNTLIYNHLRRYETLLLAGHKIRRFWNATVQNRRVR